MFEVDQFRNGVNIISVVRVSTSKKADKAPAEPHSSVSESRDKGRTG